MRRPLDQGISKAYIAYVNKLNLSQSQFLQMSEDQERANVLELNLEVKMRKRRRKYIGSSEISDLPPILFMAKPVISPWISSSIRSACLGEGNGTPFQYSCLENPMDGGTW